MADDVLMQMEADLRRRALAAEKRHVSLGELRLFITNLRHRGFSVDVKTGAQPHQLTVGIDLGGEDYTAVSPVKHLDLPTSAMLVADLASFKVKQPATSPVKAPVETPAPAPMPQLASVPKRAAAARKDPTPTPPPAKRKAPQPVEDHITGPFSTYEQAEVIRLTAQDVSDRNIALQLNRDYNSVYNWKRSNRERLREALLPAEDAQPAPKKSDDVPALTYNQRAIDAYLNALGYVDDWSAERDLRMVLMLARGEKADRVAAELKIAPNAVLQRWKAVNTKPRDLKQQADLVAVLKMRAGV